MDGQGLMPDCQSPEPTTHEHTTSPIITTKIEADEDIETNRISQLIIPQHLLLPQTPQTKEGIHPIPEIETRHAKDSNYLETHKDGVTIIGFRATPLLSADFLRTTQIGQTIRGIGAEEEEIPLTLGLDNNNHSLPHPHLQTSRLLMAGPTHTEIMVDGVVEEIPRAEDSREDTKTEVVEEEEVTLTAEAAANIRVIPSSPQGSLQILFPRWHNKQLTSRMDLNRPPQPLLNSNLRHNKVIQVTPTPQPLLGWE